MHAYILQLQEMKNSQDSAMEGGNSALVSDRDIETGILQPTPQVEVGIRFLNLCIFCTRLKINYSISCENHEAMRLPKVLFCKLNSAPSDQGRNYSLI